MDNASPVLLDPQHDGALLYYDIEIAKAIPDKKTPIEPGIEYCAGWGDHANMGIACICAYDAGEGRNRVFTFSTFGQFVELASRRRVVGFNSLRFDDIVCGFNNLLLVTTYDLLREMWRAAGLNPDKCGGDKKGYGLDATAKANGLTGKTGYGGTDPIDWQRGMYGSVIDYCLDDVRLLRRLVEGVYMRNGQINHPKGPEHGSLWLDISPIVERAKCS